MVEPVTSPSVEITAGLEEKVINQYWLTDAYTLESVVFTALGAASACWSNLETAGVFESSRCTEIGLELITRLRTDTYTDGSSKTVAMTQATDLMMSLSKLIDGWRNKSTEMFDRAKMMTELEDPGARSCYQRGVDYERRANDLAFVVKFYQNNGRI